jgi:pseudaminic acid cytidylyltransferase
VSTDDSEIAEIARIFGAETPFVRPSQLSDDFTGTIPVVAHALNWLAENAQNPELTCCIYATAPFLKVSDLRAGLALLKEQPIDYAIAVTSFPYPIQRALRISQNNRLAMHQPELFSTRSQDLESAWHDAGQFYWGRTDSWRKQLPFFNANSAPVVLPRHRVQDIDTVEDWESAEYLYLAQELQNQRPD